MDKKIKVLAYCDSPSVATGFGTVSRNIFEALYKTGRYDIDCLGINYWGDPHGLPYRIWPTGTNSERDPYGRKKVCSMIPQMDFDILFFLQDTFILDFLTELIPHLKSNTKKKFRSICYFPVDGVPKTQWIKNVSVVDYLIAYSEFGKREAENAFPNAPEMHQIPHGVNLSDYYVINEEEVKSFRKKYFGRHSDKFIFTNLNRNQQRKDIPRTIQAFVEFRKQVQNSILYLHMARQDQGWNLDEVCRAYGLSITNDIIFPENFGPNQGYPRHIVNMIYNAADCVISTTLGEGWGLSWVEAMATKTPVIMPNNTALTECITSDRGWLTDCGSTASLFTVLPNDNEVIRPLVDVDSMVKCMLDVYNNPEEVKRRTENAFDWVTTELEWIHSVGSKWVSVFDRAYNELIAGQDGNINTSTEKENMIESESF